MEVSYVVLPISLNVAWVSDALPSAGEDMVIWIWGCIPCYSAVAKVHISSTPDGMVSLDLRYLDLWMEPYI